jgi:hypothetical protein
MEKKQEEPKRYFTSGDIRDDLIDWASKLKTLGEVWGALSWHEARGGGSTDALETCGETLGRIIMEYAERIEKTITEKGINHDPLAFHRESLEWIEDTKGGGGSAGIINCNLLMLDEFIKTVSLPAFDLKERYKAMKKKYPVKPEQEAFAPAAVSAAAGA